MLGDRLRRMRERNKLTQDQVAKALGITRPAYTQYETGSRKPDPEALAKLAELYAVSIDYLVTGKSSSTTGAEPSPEQAEFLQWVEDNLEETFFYDFHKSPEEQKEEMMETLRLLWEQEKRRAARRKKEGD